MAHTTISLFTGPVDSEPQTRVKRTRKSHGRNPAKIEKAVVTESNWHTHREREKASTSQEQLVNCYLDDNIALFITSVSLEKLAIQNSIEGILPFHHQNRSSLHSISLQYKTRHGSPKSCTKTAIQNTKRSKITKKPTSITSVYAS